MEPQLQLKNQGRMPNIEVDEYVNNIPIKLENYTTQADIQEELDLKKIFANVKTAQMTQCATSVQVDILQQRIQATIYQSGKITLMGANNLDQVEKAYMVISRLLERLEQPYKITKYTVNQVLATGYFEKPLDLEKLSMLIPNSHYNPEIFPGLQFRHPKIDLRFYATIMANGSFVITGLSSERLIRMALQITLPSIKQAFIDE